MTSANLIVFNSILRLDKKQTETISAKFINTSVKFLQSVPEYFATRAMVKQLSIILGKFYELIIKRDSALYLEGTPGNSFHELIILTWQRLCISDSLTRNISF